MNKRVETQTSGVDKPVSTAAQKAQDLKANSANPSFKRSVSAPTINATTACTWVVLIRIQPTRQNPKSWRGYDVERKHIPLHPGVLELLKGNTRSYHILQLA